MSERETGTCEREIRMSKQLKLSSDEDDSLYPLMLNRPARLRANRMRARNEPPSGQHLHPRFRVVFSAPVSPPSLGPR